MKFDPIFCIIPKLFWMQVQDKKKKNKHLFYILDLNGDNTILKEKLYRKEIV